MSAQTTTDQPKIELDVSGIDLVTPGPTTEELRSGAARAIKGWRESLAQSGSEDRSSRKLADALIRELTNASDADLFTTLSDVLDRAVFTVKRHGEEPVDRDFLEAVSDELYGSSDGKVTGLLKEFSELRDGDQPQVANFEIVKNQFHRRTRDMILECMEKLPPEDREAANTVLERARNVFDRKGFSKERLESFQDRFTKGVNRLFETKHLSDGSMPQMMRVQNELFGFLKKNADKIFAPESAKVDLGEHSTAGARTISPDAMDTLRRAAAAERGEASNPFSALAALETRDPGSTPRGGSGSGGSNTDSSGSNVNSNGAAVNGDTPQVIQLGPSGTNDNGPGASNGNSPGRPDDGIVDADFEDRTGMNPNDIHRPGSSRIPPQLLKVNPTSGPKTGDDPDIEREETAVNDDPDADKDKGQTSEAAVAPDANQEVETDPEVGKKIDAAKALTDMNAEMSAMVSAINKDNKNFHVDLARDPEKGFSLEIIPRNKQQFKEKNMKVLFGGKEFFGAGEVTEQQIDKFKARIEEFKTLAVPGKLFRSSTAEIATLLPPRKSPLLAYILSPENGTRLSELKDCKVKNANWTMANLDGSQFRNVVFRKVDLYNVKARDSEWHKVRAGKATCMAGMKLDRAIVGRDCEFIGTDMEGIQLHGTEFYAIVRKSNLYKYKTDGDTQFLHTAVLTSDERQRLAMWESAGKLGRAAMWITGVTKRSRNPQKLVERLLMRQFKGAVVGSKDPVPGGDIAEFVKPIWEKITEKPGEGRYKKITKPFERQNPIKELRSAPVTTFSPGDMTYADPEFAKVESKLRDLLPVKKQKSYLNKNRAIYIETDDGNILSFVRNGVMGTEVIPLGKKQDIIEGRMDGFLRFLGDETLEDAGCNFINQTSSKKMGYRLISDFIDKEGDVTWDDVFKGSALARYRAQAEVETPTTPEPEPAEPGELPLVEDL